MYEYHEPFNEPWGFRPDEDSGMDRLGCLMPIFYLMFLIVCIIVAGLFAGCSPKVIENTITQHDTTYIERIRRESIYQHDSIYIKEWQKGDTVYVSTIKWHDRWRDVFIHDTSYVAIRDTIRVTETKEVEKRLTTWQSAQIFAGRLMIALMILALIYAGWKIYRRITKII